MNSLTRGFAISGSRRVLSASLAFVVVGTVTAALAVACSPNANIAVFPKQGVAGSAVTVSGAAFLDGVPVSLSVAGQSVGTATGANFSTSVVIPQLAPGVYTIAAKGQQPDGSVSGEGVSTFEVTASPTPATGAGPTAAAPTEAAPAQAVPTPQSAGSVRPLRGERGATPQRRSAGREDARPAPRTTAPITRAVASDPQVVSTPSGRAVFAGSVPAQRRSSDGAATARQRAATTGIARESSSARSQLPSLASPAGAAALDDGPGSQLGIGIALLAIGLVAPLAGFLIADVRRRRARAAHSSRS